MATPEPILEIERTQSFSDDLLGSLMDMRTKEEMTDFSVKVNNAVIPCHSVVMSAASPYFRVLLQCPMKEAAIREVDLDFMDEVYVHRVVDYCYTGRITVELSMAETYLDIAEYFHLTALKCHIEKFVCEHLSPKNCIGWCYRADKYRMDELEKQSRAMMTSDFPHVVEHPEFHELTMTELLDYVVQVVSVTDGDTVLEACFNWVTYNVQSRSEHFLDILNHIRLDKCSKSCLKRIMQNWRSAWPNHKEIQQTLRMSISSLSQVPKKTPTPKKLKLLLLGGHTQQNVLNRNCWAFDMMSGKCELVGKMAHFAVMYRAMYCSTKKGIFVMGGSRSLNNFVEQTTCSFLSVDTLQWTKLPDLHQPLQYAVALCVNNRIYTFGGNPSLYSVYCLDLTTKKWSFRAKMPVKNVFPIVGAVDDKVFYIFHSTPANEDFRTTHKIEMHCFDRSTNMWCTLMDLPDVVENTRGAEAVTTGDELYVIGGWSRLCARYLPKTNTWALLKRPLHVHRAFSTVHMNGKIILVGGFDKREVCHSSVEVYDIAEDKWYVDVTTMPAALRYHHCAVYDEATKEMVL